MGYMFRLYRVIFGPSKNTDPISKVVKCTMGSHRLLHLVSIICIRTSLSGIQLLHGAQFDTDGILSSEKPNAPLSIGGLDDFEHQ